MSFWKKEKCPLCGRVVGPFNKSIRKIGKKYICSNCCKYGAPDNPLNNVSEHFLGTVEEQDALIAKIQDAENKYKEDNDLESLVAFWNRIWSQGGLNFNGVHMHFRAVDLNLQVGDNDRAWALLQKIILRHPEYDVNVYKYRYKIMLKEKRYMGSLEHLVDRYAVDVGYDRDHFLTEARKVIRKVDVPANKTVSEIAEKLADIGEVDQDILRIHKDLKEYYQDINWLKRKE